MAEQNRCLRLIVEPVGDVTVVRFTLRDLVKEGTVEAIGETLDDLVEVQGCRRLVLNMGGVEGATLSSNQIDHLIAS